MDEELETLLVGVRADTRGFAGDVAALKGELEGSLGAGAERAGRAIEGALGRAIRTGKLGFDDLRRAAVAALAEIARGAVMGGIGAIGGGGTAGGLASVASGLVGALIGAPGRATGGPVSPNRPYWVGKRGPELFVPTASGSVAPAGAAAPRDVRVAIRIEAPAGSAPQALARSSRQVARAVRAALEAER